ncbi:hypothetical protein ABPG74_014402 [Tetrahymena malaccensis]
MSSQNQEATFSNEPAKQLLPSQLNVESQQLFQFDLNFDSLKKYLNNIANTINQHAQLINGLQNDVQNKILSKILPDNYKTLHEGMNFANNDMVSNLKKDIGKLFKAENNPQTQELNKLANKLAMLTQLSSSDSLRTQQLEAKVAKLEDLISQKVSKDDLKDKHSKLKLAVQNDLSENKTYFEKKIYELEKKLLIQLNTYDDKISDVEKNTLWRIQDCEEIIKKRVTQDYVDNSFSAFQEKIIRDMKASTAGDSERIDSIQQDLAFKIKMLQESFTEKQNSLKQNIKEVDEKLAKKAMMKEIFDEFNKQNNNNLNELRKKIAILEKQADNQQEIERMQQKIKFLEEFTQQIIQDFDNRFADLLPKAIKNGTGGADANFSWLSPHKICEIETNIKRCSTENKRLREDFEDYKKAVDMKIQHFEMSQFEKDKQGSNLNLELIVKDMQEQIQQQLSKIDDGKAAKFEIERMQKRIEAFKDLERRVQKFMRDIDVNGIQRQLKCKAEGEDVLKDFAIVDSKINNNTESIQYLRKDLDNILVLYKKILQLLQQTNVSDQNSMAILTTKKLHSVQNLNCLSCGTQRKQSSAHKISSSQIKLTTEQCNTSISDNNNNTTNAFTATGSNFTNNMQIQKVQIIDSRPKRSNSTSKLRPYSARK